jgi:hypothetical protein
MYGKDNTHEFDASWSQKVFLTDLVTCTDDLIRNSCKSALLVLAFWGKPNCSILLHLGISLRIQVLHQRSVYEPTSFISLRSAKARDVL